MTEIKTLAGKPLYRLFNVLLFIAYSSVFLAAILAGIVGYQERGVKDATIICRDGTSWDALEPKNVLYDNYAKCGLCTKRYPSGSYVHCSYNDMDYDSYETETTQKLWSWSTIIELMRQTPL